MFNIDQNMAERLLVFIYFGSCIFFMGYFFWRMSEEQRKSQPRTKAGSIRKIMRLYGGVISIITGLWLTPEAKRYRLLLIISAIALLAPAILFGVRNVN